MNRTDLTGTGIRHGAPSLARKTCHLSLAIAMAFGATTAAQAAEVLTHHVRSAVSEKTASQVGSLANSQVMSLDVVLPVRDQAGLDAFVAAVNDPSSPSFHQFLTPAQFTARFGPTQSDYNAVVQYLGRSGLTVTGGSRDGMDVQVSGPVAAVEAAFNVKMRTYQHPSENRVFYSPDREPTTGLAIPLWHVSGLDNYSLPHPLYVKKSDYAAANGISPEAVVTHATTGSGPSASFLGSDMRAAYYGGTTLTGAGQNLGLFEYEGTDLADLTTYYKNVKQTNNVPVTLLSTDGTSTACVYKSGCDDTEQTLDMTQALGMAPGLSSLVMYVGSTDTAIISAMTTHSPLPTTIGCSWGWTPADPTTLDPYFEKMAAQGQTFFAASGDSSTWSKRNEAWRSMEIGDSLGRQRRRHFARQDCHSVLAETLRRDQFQQQGIDHLSQWTGCFGQCKLYLLHLRRPDHLPSQRIRRYQLCGADVGGLYRAGESTGHGQWRFACRQLQRHYLPAEHHQHVCHRLPRHHQWQVRQLLGGNRL
jgi:hypothetical protein